MGDDYVTGVQSGDKSYMITSEKVHQEFLCARNGAQGAQLTGQRFCLGAAPPAQM